MKIKQQIFKNKKRDQNDEMKSADQNQRLSNEKDKQEYSNKNFASLGINLNFTNIINEIKALLKGSEGNKLYWTAMVDKKTYWPSFENGYLFTSITEQDSLYHCNTNTSLRSNINHLLVYKLRNVNGRKLMFYN